MTSSFRKMRRFKQQLTSQECDQVLSYEKRATLAVQGENGYPYAIPINFLYKDGKVYFHCAKAGQKIDAMRANPHVCLTLHDAGHPVEGKQGLDVRSVIVFGTVHMMDANNATMSVCREFGLKYFDESYVDHEIEKAGKRVQMVEITIDHMTGKLVNES